MSFSTWRCTRVITETKRLVVSGIPVEVVRKGIKNLHLGVYPPDGRVRVAVPKVISDEAVRLAVIDKLGWIKRKRAAFLAQPRQSAREMVTGESHYFLGQRYRLQVIATEAAGYVVLGKRSLQLHVRADADEEYRFNVLQEWYRAQLKVLVPDLLAKWQDVVGVQAADWRVKKMKTKWGSCNAQARRIWLNLELAKKPVNCLEYIIAHELAHLVERLHCQRFTALMDRAMPQWPRYRAELNQMPLGHEEW